MAADTHAKNIDTILQSVGLTIVDVNNIILKMMFSCHICLDDPNRYDNCCTPNDAKMCKTCWNRGCWTFVREKQECRKCFTITLTHTVFSLLEISDPLP